MDLRRKKLLLSIVILSVAFMGMTRAEADPEPVPEPEPEANPEALPESKPDSEGDAQYYGGGGLNSYYNPGAANPCIGGNCMQASNPCYGGNCIQASNPCVGGNCGISAMQPMPIMQAVMQPMPIMQAVMQPMPVTQTVVQPMPVAQTSNSVCGMTDKCCGMASKDCCLGGEQKCYTVYDRVCDGQTSKPECTVRKNRDCHNVQDRSCRRVLESQMKEYETSECRQVPNKKCMNYERKVCNKKIKTIPESITWLNEKLVVSNIQEQHCLNQTKVNCTPRTESRSVPRRVRKQRPVVKSQKKCSQVPNRQPDQTVSVPVTKVVYRTMCYNVPRTTCAQTPCNVAAPCVQGASVCSMSETQTQSICPQPMAGGYPVGGVGVIGGGAVLGGGVTGCQQIQQPVCTDANICQAQAQQCCQVTNEQVCRQVPQRVTEMATQVIPGQVTYSDSCTDTPYTTYESYYETVNEESKTTVNDCQTSVEPQCHNYNSPTYEVENVDQTETAQVQVEECEVTTVNEEKCHTYYDAECSTKMIKKQLKFYKTVCDQIVNRQQCIDIPLTDCTVGKTATCRMQARQVCQDTCSKSQLCNDCDQFRNGPGFGSCGTSTCGTFLPKDPYTLGSNGQQIIGGEGIYTGGQGSFDGVVNVGGEGYYPGTVGGSGFYPGVVGGEGYYPGGEGEVVGGENYYPGTSSCVGSGCDENAWDDAFTPPMDDGRQPWDDALTPPGGRPDYGFNVAPAVPMGVDGDQSRQEVFS